jgi:transposase
MSVSNKKSCIVCGGELSPGKRGGQRKFCSIKCGSSYHNRRNAIKPILSGGTVTCPQCGNEFERSDKTKRECCSLTCAHKWNWRNERDEIRRKAEKQKGSENPGDFKAWVLSLHSAGYSRGAIIDALGLPLRTFRGWIEQHNKECKQSGLPKKRGYPRNYKGPQTAEEWLSALRNGSESIDSERIITDEIDGRPIHLVCGATVSGKGADCLCADIQARLKMNPFSGEVFVYCGKRYDRVRYIYWDGGGFNVITRRCESGTYPWPPSKIGEVICATDKDLDLILRGSPNIRIGSISWDSFGFSENNFCSYV